MESVLHRCENICRSRYIAVIMSDNWLAGQTVDVLMKHLLKLYGSVTRNRINTTTVNSLGWGCFSSTLGLRCAERAAGPRNTYMCFESLVLAFHSRGDAGLIRGHQRGDVMLPCWRTGRGREGAVLFLQGLFAGWTHVGVGWGEVRRVAKGVFKGGGGWRRWLVQVTK